MLVKVQKRPKKKMSEKSKKRHQAVHIKLKKWEKAVKKTKKLSKISKKLLMSTAYIYIYTT